MISRQTKEMIDTHNTIHTAFWFGVVVGVAIVSVVLIILKFVG